MPELPEVETYRRDLVPVLQGRTIRRVLVRDTPNAPRIFRRQGTVGFAEQLEGARLEGIGRIGKFLVLRTDRRLAWIIHLGMSGRLMLTHSAPGYPPHTHVAAFLDPPAELRFVDPRSFGEMFLSAHAGGTPDELAHLGVDPLHHWPPATELAGRLARRTARIKHLLMDQRFVAGLGNIYSDEALHRAGVRYDRRADELTGPEVRRLHAAIPAVLEEAIGLRGTSMPDESYRDLDGSLGGFGDLLRVYGRAGEPCRTCGTPIERGRWANRSTFFCPRCQR